MDPAIVFNVNTQCDWARDNFRVFITYNEHTSTINEVPPVVTVGIHPSDAVPPNYRTLSALIERSIWSTDKAPDILAMVITPMIHNVVSSCLLFYRKQDVKKSVAADAITYKFDAAVVFNSLVSIGYVDLVQSNVVELHINNGQGKASRIIRFKKEGKSLLSLDSDQPNDGYQVVVITEAAYGAIPVEVSVTASDKVPAAPEPEEEVSIGAEASDDTVSERMNLVLSEQDDRDASLLSSIHRDLFRLSLAEITELETLVSHRRVRLEAYETIHHVRDRLPVIFTQNVDTASYLSRQANLLEELASHPEVTEEAVRAMTVTIDAFLMIHRA